MITQQNLNPLVLSLVGTPELAIAWWNSHNKHFNETPLSALSKDPKAVRDYLLGYCL
jgi:hypothetical protein